jgi:hypothetical protein
MAARAAQGARNAGPAVPQAFSQGSDMRPGELMLPGQSLASPDGQFQLVYQADGNLVVYRTGGGATWASNTGGTSAGVCVLQRDGNLVVYDAARVPRWASGTNGHQDIGLRLQTDGNLVLHRDGQVIWQTGATAPAAVRPVIVRNTSPTSVTVRFYHVNDTVKLATLPDGVRTIPPGGTVNWTLPAGFQEVKVTFNGRNDKTVVAGQTVTFETDERVRILNRSPRAISVRIYLETDIVRLVTLPGGDLSVPPGGEVTWEMPQDIETAMVIMNNRTREVAIRGKTLTYAQDDRILVKNLSPRVARAQFYNVRDTVLWVTLPGGDLRVPPNGDAFFTVPSNLSAVQVRVGGQRVVADTGAVLNVQADGTVTTG